jgi:hypothetical protein
MAVKTAQQAADNWAAGMANPQAATKYKQGISAYAGNPMQQAATPAALALYAQNTARAAQPGGRLVVGLNNADPNVWRQNALTIGAQRLASGGTKGKAKFTSAANRLSPIWAQMQSAAHAIPKGGLANAQARSNAALAVLMQATGKA